ncbi:MAG: hypothetical protein AAB263_20605 [Planctomycetota bacterium]
MSAWLQAGEAETPKVETPKVVQDQLNALKPDLDKAKAEYAKKLNVINAKLITFIQAAMIKETKAGNLDNAVALKNALEKAKAGEYVDRILSQPASDMLGDDEPGFPLPAGRYTVSGKCDDRATVYVNGKQVLECSADEVRAEVQIQDRISIMAKCFDGGGGYGFSLKLVDANGKQVIATQTNGRWKAYTPTNEEKWWLIDAQTKMRPALAGRCDWVIDGAHPIWAEDTLRDCYIVFGR